MPGLQGRVVIVTGGGHGLGRAYCRGAAGRGAKVVVVDIDGPAAEGVAEEVRKEGGEAFALRIDVADEQQTVEMAQATVDRFGRIDGIINNAAIFLTIPITRAPLEETTVEEWDRVMAVNVKGVFLCCKAVAPYMKQQGYGKIVNIASTTALQGLSGIGPYPVSKAAVMGITRGLARDLGAYNITVNSIAPGGTVSADGIDEAEVRQRREGLEVQPGRRMSGVTMRAIRRLETPSDLVGTALFLLSADSDFISGQTIVVDGGSYMT